MFTPDGSLPGGAELGGVTLDERHTNQVRDGPHEVRFAAPRGAKNKHIGLYVIPAPNPYITKEEK